MGEASLKLQNNGLRRRLLLPSVNTTPRPLPILAGSFKCLGKKCQEVAPPCSMIPADRSERDSAHDGAQRQRQRTALRKGHAHCLLAWAISAVSTASRHL